MEVEHRISLPFISIMVERLCIRVRLYLQRKIKSILEGDGIDLIQAKMITMLSLKRPIHQREMKQKSAAFV